MRGYYIKAMNRWGENEVRLKGYFSNESGYKIPNNQSLLSWHQHKHEENVLMFMAV